MTPTQADREDAAYLMINLSGYDPGVDSRIREGRFDTHAAVECITSVRLAAEAAAFEKAARVALREVRDEGNGAAVKANAGIIYQDIRKLAGEKHD